MATRNLKAWTGSEWAAKPLKYWTGAAWREAQLKWADAEGAWLPVASPEATFALSGVATAGQWNAYGDDDPTRIVSGPITTTAGRGLVVLFGYEGLTEPSIVSDSKDNAGWIVSEASPVTAQYGAYEVYLRVAYLPVIDNAGEDHTVKVDWNGSGFGHMAVYEVELPPGKVLTLDVRQFTVDNTSPYEDTITPLGDDVLAFVHVLCAGQQNTPALPAAPGWTFQYDEPFTNVNWPFVVGTRAISGAAPTAMSLTFGGPQDDENMLIGLTTFKAAVEASPVAYAASTLLHFNGAGSAITDDVSDNVWEAVGGATQNATVAMAAGSSLALSGAGQYVKSVTSLSRYVFGAGDFRICFTLLWDRTGASPYPAFIDFRDAGGNIGKGFVIYGDASWGGLSLYADNDDGTEGIDFTIGQIPDDGAPSEVEVSRRNGVLSCFVRGQRSYYQSFPWSFDVQASQLCIGARYFDDSQFVKGRFDEVLIEKGVGGHVGALYRPPTVEWVRATAPWTPAAMSNTKVWYVADSPDNTVSGGAVIALADKGGGDFTATAVNAGADFTTDALNGRPVLRANGGSGIFMTLAGGDAVARTAGGITIYTVHRQVSRDGASYPAVGSATFGAGTNTLQVALMREQDGHQPGSINLRTRPNNFSGGLEVSDEWNYGTSWLVAGGSRRFNHDDGALFINGEQTATASMPADDVTQDTDMSLIVGGYTAWAGDYWTQNIAEILFVRDDVSGADRLRLDGYLAWEWGLQDLLPIAHPYRSHRPMAGGPDAVPTVVPSTGTWTEIAIENQPFTLDAPGRVRYGTDSRWVEMDLAAGNWQCTSDQFGGDPASGVLKACQLLAT